MAILAASPSINAPSEAKKTTKPLESKETAANSGKLFRGKVTVSVAQGEQLFMERKYAEAANLFRQEINHNSRDVDAYAGLGMSLAMQFKLDGAAEQFDKALKLDPSNAVAHAGKALVLLNKLQSSNLKIIQSRESILNEAADNARKAVAQDETLQQGHYVLGKVLLEQGKLDEAYESFQKAADVDALFSPAYTGMGQIDFKQGRMEQASTNLKRAVKLNPGNSTAHYALGELLLQQGAVEDAIKELNISLYQHANGAPVHMALGKAYDAQGNYDAALKQFERAALIKPELKEAYTRQADLHVKLGKQQMDSGTVVGALKEFKQAILIDPLNPTPYLCMAHLRERRGDLELAIAELRSGLELIPNDSSLHKRIAENLLKVGQLDDAIGEFEKALNASPDAACIHGLTQALYLKSQGQSQDSFFASNDYENAEATLERAIKLKPNDLKLRLAQAKLRSLAGRPVDLSTIGTPHSVPEKIAYAEALLAQNRFAESGDQMKQVIAQLDKPQDAIAVADICMLNMDHDSAEAAFQRAATLGNANRAKFGLAAVQRLRSAAQQRLNLAADLSKKKQLKSAADTYRDAIAADPRLPGARLGLAQVEERLADNSPESLRNAVTQYQAYLQLAKNLPEKEHARILKHAQQLQAKAGKIEAKKAVATR